MSGFNEWIAVENKNMPKKLRVEKRLSAYGAERNKPAGDTMCNTAAMRAVLVFCVPCKGSMRNASAYRMSTERR